MSALEGLRHQIEATNTALGVLLQDLEEVKSRVAALEVRPAQPAAAPVAQAPKATTPPAQASAKSPSLGVGTSTGGTGTKSVSGKS